MCFTQRAREGKFHFFHHHWIVAHSEENGSTRDVEMNLEAGDALGGEKWTWRREVDSEETWTAGREKYTWRTRVRSALDEGALGGYRKRSWRIRLREAHPDDTEVKQTRQARRIRLE